MYKKFSDKIKDYNLKVFLNSCSESGFKVNDVRWIENNLFCTLHTSRYGILNDIKVCTYIDRFKLVFKGETLGSFFREIDFENDENLEEEFESYFKRPTSSDFYKRGCEKTKRKTRYR